MVEKNCPAIVHKCLPSLADKHLASYKGETETRLFGLKQGDLFDLDGHLLHDDGIRSWVKDNLVGISEDKGRDALAALLPALKDVQDQVGGKASEFFCRVDYGR